MHTFLVLLVGGGGPSAHRWHAVEAQDARKAAEIMTGEGLRSSGRVEHLRALVWPRGRRQGPFLFYEDCGA